MTTLRVTTTHGPRETVEYLRLTKTGKVTRTEDPAEAHRFDDATAAEVTAKYRASMDRLCAKMANPPAYRVERV